MKKKSLPKVELPEDDMQPEYDFSNGVRGKYAHTLRENGYTTRIYHDDGTTSERVVLGEKMVVLESDVWEYFQDSETVNHALRTLISLVPEKAVGASNRK